MMLSMSAVTIPLDMTSVKWRLPDIMEKHGVTAYKLGKQIGDVTRMSTIYRLSDKEHEPTRIDFRVLVDVVGALEQLTGESFTASDLIEIVDDGK